MRQMNALNELREQGSMTWIEQEHGWVAAPEEIVKALSRDGFEECKREMTTSRRDRRPAGGVWHGIDTRTGSVALAIWVNRPPWHQAIVAGGMWQGFKARTGPVASAIWVNRPAWDQAIVFIAINGELLKEMGTKWAQSSFPPAWGSGARSLDPSGRASECNALDESGRAWEYDFNQKRWHALEETREPTFTR